MKNNIKDQVCYEVWWPVRDQVGEHVTDQVDVQVLDKVRDHIQVRDQVTVQIIQVLDHINERYFVYG